MDKKKILVLNGPNLGHVGQRQPEIYGSEDFSGLPDALARLSALAAGRVELDFFQSNSEGDLIDRLELAREEKIDGVVLNAGAYTHTSLALADCLAWIGLPCLEVHLSNVWARPEKMRHTSLMAPHVVGVIAGFGLTGYALAVCALLEHLDRQT